MVASRIIRLPRDDHDSAYVLIQASSIGCRPLDIKLVGTEGEAPYATTLKHDRVASLRVKNCLVSEPEWQTILQAVLSQQPTLDIQATASIQSEALSITIRKRIQGITQRLGSITLNYDEDNPIELFQWCATSAEILAKGNEALAEAARHAQKLETSVNELKAQLDELVAAKQDDETALLQKFRDLLNEKKVRIREQQKIIGAAALQGGQPSSSSQQCELSQPQTSRRPAPSPGKRKVHATKAESNPADDDEMEVDTIKLEPEASDLDRVTEDTASGASDDDEDDDDIDEEEEKIDNNTRAQPPRKSKSKPKERTAPPKKASEQPPPPPRSLPFARKKAAVPEPGPEAAGGGSETESDDEL